MLMKIAKRQVRSTLNNIRYNFENQNESNLQSELDKYLENLGEIDTRKKLFDFVQEVTFIFTEGDGFTRSLDVARKHSDSFLIYLEDNSWRIGVICPVILIKCSEEKMQDFITEVRGSPEDDIVIFQRAVEGRPFESFTNDVEPGDEVWIHPDLQFFKGAIEALLFNELVK